MQLPDHPSSVDIAKLRQAVDLIFDHIQNDHKISVLKIPERKELYWDMGIDDRFSVPDGPAEPTIGSIRDDVFFLESMLRSSSDSLHAPALMLMHVCPILLLLCDVIRG